MFNKLHGYLATDMAMEIFPSEKKNSTLHLQMILLPTSSSLARDTLLYVLTNERQVDNLISSKVYYHTTLT